MDEVRYRVIAESPYTVEVAAPSGTMLYVRAAGGDIAHVTAIHPLVERTHRLLVLVSTHSSLGEQLDFLHRELGADAAALGPTLEDAVTEVLAQAMLAELAA